MRPTSRNGVNKYSSAKRFKNDGKRTKAPNMAAAPMRGGFRL